MEHLRHVVSKKWWWGIPASRQSARSQPRSFSGLDERRGDANGARVKRSRTSLGLAFVIGLVLTAVGSLAPSAYADKAPPQPAPSASAPASAPEAITPGADDPGCIGKFRGQICDLPDRSGGVCGPARCGNDRPCLKCYPVRMENDGLDGLWPALLAFGMLVCIVGFVFWFRLKKRWNEAVARERDQGEGPQR